MNRSGTNYKLITNEQGSIRFVMLASTGVVQQEITYDEYGNITADTNSGFQPFGFAGGIYDPDTKLTRFGARDYDAEIGRWTAKDPIRFNGGDTNLYGYVLQDPVNYVDPKGKKRLCIRVYFSPLWMCFDDDPGEPPVDYDKNPPNKDCIFMCPQPPKEDYPTNRPDCT